MEFNRPTVPDPTETLAERTIAGKYSSQKQQRKTTTEAQSPAFDSTLKATTGQNNSLFQESPMTLRNPIFRSHMNVNQSAQLVASMFLRTNSAQ